MPPLVLPLLFPSADDSFLLLEGILRKGKVMKIGRLTQGDERSSWLFRADALSMQGDDDRVGG